MPKLGMQPIRRDALVNAAIAQVGAHGPDVTVAQIARQAGISPALAHHYFDGKADLMDHAMRAILRDYGAAVRAELAKGGDRVEAVVRASFAPGNFRRDVVAAWLTFYTRAQKSDTAARLLRVYQQRVRSNLRAGLRTRGHADPEGMAETLAALIDGVYLRVALGGRIGPAAACAQVLRVLE
ncbi:transcriptional regulator BetI [Maribius pontilimi]|uniref:HTH-type transcriptional regulator BetI n=1 Tax=Palleronia pontilimi TaxID=1964209 RepID=A0A934MC18_9RHOB|nr:transcriptional regulator BetI [Palleronia pontilimi]MBJ3762303.1 transcriptional regulator BetI [Palleronia pontilimi]